MITEAESFSKKYHQQTNLSEQLKVNQEKLTLE